jgi:hypothetical protein
MMEDRIIDYFPLLLPLIAGLCLVAYVYIVWRIDNEPETLEEAKKNDRSK